MDEEANFANLLSQSTANVPTWNTPGLGQSSPDPWANPFSSEPSSNPFASSTSAFGSISAYVPAIGPDSPTRAFRLDEPEFSSPREEISPYVQKLEEDDRIGKGTLPDPPSVIAAREQEALNANARYNDGYNTSQNYLGGPIPVTRDDPFTVPYSPLRTQQPTVPYSISEFPSNTTSTISPASRKLPSDLIDEDLMAASDPSISLKKAFVKSSTSSRNIASKADVGVEDVKPKRHVFAPEKKVESEKVSTVVKEQTVPQPSEDAKQLEADAKLDEVQSNEEDIPSEIKSSNNVKNDVEEIVAIAKPEADDAATPVAKVPAVTVDGQQVDEQSQSGNPAHNNPASIPLPPSAVPTPTMSRATTPLPPLQSQAIDERPQTEKGMSTPSMDRVSVSPLDGPATDHEADYGFKALSIGGSSMPTPVLPSKSEWDDKVTPVSSRFGGKGWGAMDNDDDGDDGGLFGKGGPSLRSDPWGSEGGQSNGWEDPASTPASAGPSHNSYSAYSTPVKETSALPSTSTEANTSPPTPSKPKQTQFSITVGDPTRVGDPVRGYTVYTVRTRTTSPHYRKSDFSVLRRFSDFLWLYDALVMNNPGVIVPPMPDKQPWGRFQDQFIETRRLALARCLNKITSHPVLQLDPDLRLFLESDSFAIEAKQRRAELPPEKNGLLSNWTGPKYYEQDDWFESRKSYLDALESQLKGLSKSIEASSKTKLELAISMGDFADSITALAESDLGSAMCAALARLSDLIRREKETNEEQAKLDVMHLLNLSDEYVRFIASVRLAFTGRIKAYHHWQAMEKEVVRLRSNREKLRQQGKLGDRVQSTLAEINEAERKVRDSSADFENVSRLVKSEFARFEQSRVQEFKKIMEKQLDKQIEKQKKLINAWEEYHGIVLKMVQKSQGQHIQSPV